MKANEQLLENDKTCKPTVSTLSNFPVIIPDPNPVDEAEEEAESAAVTALLAGAKTGTIKEQP